MYAFFMLNPNMPMKIVSYFMCRLIFTKPQPNITKFWQFMGDFDPYNDLGMMMMTLTLDRDLDFEWA